MSCGGIADNSINAVEFLQGIGLRPGLEFCFGVGLAGRSFNALFNSISAPVIVIALPQLHPENYFLLNWPSKHDYNFFSFFFGSSVAILEACRMFSELQLQDCVPFVRESIKLGPGLL